VLTVRDEGGRVLLRRRVEGERVRVRVPVRFTGTTRLRLSTDPDAEPVGAADPRTLSVYFAGPITFTPR
jgi:hypothetical protein